MRHDTTEIVETIEISVNDVILGRSTRSRHSLRHVTVTLRYGPVTDLCNRGKSLKENEFFYIYLWVLQR